MSREDLNNQIFKNFKIFGIFWAKNKQSVKFGFSISFFFLKELCNTVDPPSAKKKWPYERDDLSTGGQFSSNVLSYASDSDRRPDKRIAFDGSVLLREDNCILPSECIWYQVR